MAVIAAAGARAVAGAEAGAEARAEATAVAATAAAGSAAGAASCNAASCVGCRVRRSGASLVTESRVGESRCVRRPSSSCPLPLMYLAGRLLIPCEG